MSVSTLLDTGQDWLQPGAASTGAPASSGTPYPSVPTFNLTLFSRPTGYPFFKAFLRGYISVQVTLAFPPLQNLDEQYLPRRTSASLTPLFHTPLTDRNLPPPYEPGLRYSGSSPLPLLPQPPHSPSTTLFLREPGHPREFFTVIRPPCPGDQTLGLLVVVPTLTVPLYSLQSLCLRHCS